MERWIEKERGLMYPKDKIYLYCWGCKTSQIMQGEKSKIWKETILYKCPNCGFMNTKKFQPDTREQILGAHFFMLLLPHSWHIKGCEYAS